MRTRAPQAPRGPSAAARSAPEGRADLPLPCPAPTSLLLGLHGLHGGHGRPLRLSLVLRLHGRPHGLGADLRVADVAGERERGEVRAQRARGGPEGFPGGFPEGSPRSPPAPRRYLRPACRQYATMAAPAAPPPARSAPAGRGKTALPACGQSASENYLLPNQPPSCLREGDQWEMSGRSSRRRSPLAAANERAACGTRLPPFLLEGSRGGSGGV